MNIDFPLILVVLTFMSGLVYLFDVLFLARRRNKTQKKMPVIIEYSRSLFPVFLIVLVIRSFIVQPFRVPSGSLKPTVLTNEFLVVNQFAYGLRLPVLNKKIVNVGEPKTGDIVVFRFPGNPKVNFVKRVIGVPGDHVVYQNKTLTINGKVMSQTFVKNAVDMENGKAYPVKVMKEDLNGVMHEIYVQNANHASKKYDLIVPKDNYFVMGDNRDGSADSRYWGFLPEKYLIAKAMMIWLSWDSDKFNVRWSRIGTML